MILHGREAGQGPPVAFLHGLFGAARNFGAAQRALAPRFRTLALDLRNHGDSPHAADMRYAAMAADVTETLAARAMLPAALVGHSMGGKVAMTAALLRPDAVSRLVVVDIAPVVNPPQLRGYLRAMAALEPSPALTRAAADATLAEDISEPHIRGFLLQSFRFGAAAGWRLGLPEIAAAMPAIEGWDAPTSARYDGPALFMAGARSDYIRPQHHAAIRALFPAARIVTIKDAGHWVHADNPAEFMSVLEQFLAE